MIYVLTVEMQGTEAEIREATGALQHAAEQMSSTGFTAEINDDDGLIVIEGASCQERT